MTLDFIVKDKVVNTEKKLLLNIKSVALLWTVFQKFSCTVLVVLLHVGRWWCSRDLPSGDSEYN